MREILFRAKRLDNGEWVEGQLAYFFDQKESPYIMPQCYYASREMGEDENGNPIIGDEMCFGGFWRVDPATLGQFTGLTDKNGNKIWEGGKLNKRTHEKNNWASPREFRPDTEITIVYRGDGFVCKDSHRGILDIIMPLSNGNEFTEYEVIDTPEILQNEKTI